MIASETGWAWEYIDEEMTLPKMRAFVTNWHKFPPAWATLARIAAALGIKAQTESRSAEAAERRALIESGSDEMIADFAAAGFQIEVPRNGLRS